MTTETVVTPTATTEIESAQEVLAKWEATSSKLEADAQALLDSANELIALGEISAEEVAQKVVTLRAQAAVSREAIPGAVADVHTAKVRAVLAAAAAIDAEADQAQAAVDERQAVTDGLLAQLREHEGVSYVLAATMPQARTKIEQDAVDQLRLQASVAKAVAAGGRPGWVDVNGRPADHLGVRQLEADDYPPVVRGVDAIIPV